MSDDLAQEFAKLTRESYEAQMVARGITEETDALALAIGRLLLEAKITEVCEEMRNAPREKH